MSAHRPVRTCVGCGQKRDKDELLRIVRTPESNLEMDPEAKKPGRGAYLCYDVQCVREASRKNSIGRHLHVRTPAKFYDEVSKYVARKA